MQVPTTSSKPQGLTLRVTTPIHIDLAQEPPMVDKDKPWKLTASEANFNNRFPNTFAPYPLVLALAPTTPASLVKGLIYLPYIGETNVLLPLLTHPLLSVDTQAPITIKDQTIVLAAPGHLEPLLLHLLLPPNNNQIHKGIPLPSLQITCQGSSANRMKNSLHPLLIAMTHLTLFAPSFQDYPSMTRNKSSSM